MTIYKRILFIAAVVAGTFGMSSCQNDSGEPSAADKALSDLQRKYDELVEERVGNPVQWAADDIENIGDWDYRVENLAFTSGEELAEKLGEFGDDRWEAIWFERTPGGFLVILKKPSISYLSKIPLSQLGKFVIGGPEGQE